MSEQSEQLNELGMALAKAQSVIKDAMRDSANPFFKSTYADLASVWDAARHPLSSNGLSVVQTTEANDAGVIVVTTLLHSSGQWIRGRLLMKPTKNDPQGIGSCITYARRYALAAIVGISPADDDGNAASEKPAASGKPATKPAATPEQQEVLMDKILASFVSSANPEQLKMRHNAALKKLHAGDLPADWKSTIDAEFETHSKRLK